ncbi:MAG: hypothetical protein ACRDPW_05760 [Mycobacteriales bacterium]
MSALHDCYRGYAALYQTVQARGMIDYSEFPWLEDRSAYGGLTIELVRGAVERLDSDGLRAVVLRHQRLQVQSVDLFCQEMAGPRREFSNTEFEYGSDGVMFELCPSLPDVYERSLARSALYVPVSYNAPARPGVAPAATVRPGPQLPSGPVIADAARRGLVGVASRLTGQGRASTR